MNKNEVIESEPIRKLFENIDKQSSEELVITLNSVKKEIDNLYDKVSNFHKLTTYIDRETIVDEELQQEKDILVYNTIACRKLIAFKRAEYYKIKLNLINLEGDNNPDSELAIANKDVIESRVNEFIGDYIALDRDLRAWNSFLMLIKDRSDVVIDENGFIKTAK